MTLPLASQTLETLKGKESIRRSAVCPVHNKKTSKFIGPNQNEKGELHWVMECLALWTPENKASHMFACRPDPSAPKPGTEMEWLARQRAARLKVLSRTQS